MQSKEMKEFVINLLQQNLPPTYFYHNYQHTLYVLANAETIGRSEAITEHEMHLLKAAALWHDTGYIHVYTGHEFESCLLAKKHLPDFGFNENEIRQICGMIMATMVPQDPHNKLEEILADADLEYLGTSKAPALANQLFLELQAINPKLTEAEWTETQVSFLKTHRFFTAYCKKKCGPQKEAYAAQLQKLL